MGKIRVKTLGDESFEEEQKEKQKKAREDKKKIHVAGMKGGERTATVGVSEEDIEKTLDAAPAEPEVSTQEPKKEKKVSKYAKKKGKVSEESKRYKENASLVNKDENYTLSKAVEVLKKFKPSKFDETVELHVNVNDKGVSGVVTLPHGTGKKLNIKVADETLISEIEKGKIDFDVLVATPDMMPKLAKVARILGPRGLMPNPKNGTITQDTKEAIEKLSAGQVSFKTEAGGPIIHMSVGKLSFKENQLEENLKTVFASIGVSKVKSATLKSTMSPGIRLKV